MAMWSRVSIVVPPMPPQIELELAEIYGKRTESIRHKTPNKGFIEVLRRAWRFFFPRCTSQAVKVLKMYGWTEPLQTRVEDDFGWKVAIGREIQRYFAPWVCGRPFLADFQSTLARILNGSTNPGQEIRQKELHYAWIYLGIRAFSSALLYISPSFAMLAVLLMMLGLNNKNAYDACVGNEIPPTNPCHSLHFESHSSLPWLRMHLQGKELSAEKVFFIFTTVGLSRAPLGGVAMGFSAVVDGLTAFRRLNAFVNASDWSMTALAWQMSMSCERTGFVKAKEQKHLGSLIWRSNLKMPWWANSLLQ